MANLGMGDTPLASGLTDKETDWGEFTGETARDKREEEFDSELLKLQEEEEAEKLQGEEGGYERQSYVPPTAGSFRQEQVQEYEQEQADKEDETSLSEGVGLAVESEWIGANMKANGKLSKFSPDPDFVPDAKQVREIAGEEINDINLDEETREQIYSDIANSDSLEEATARSKRAKGELKTRQKLAEMGYKGISLQVGAAILDPTAWVIGAGVAASTGGLGALAVGAKRISTATRVGLKAAKFSSAAAVPEAILQENKAVEHQNSVLYAAMLGGGLGAAGGLARMSPEAGQRLRGLFKSSSDEVESNATRRAENMGGTGDAGAAQTSRKTPINEDNVSVEEFERRLSAGEGETIAPKTAFGNLRFSSMAIGKRSENPGVRAMANGMAEDAVGNANRKVPTDISASERRLQYNHKTMAEWSTKAEPNYHAWRSEQPLGRFKGSNAEHRAREAFNEEVTAVARGLTDSPSAAVNSQASTMSKLFKTMYDDAHNPGAYRGETRRSVKGFEKDGVDDYVPRQYNLENIRKLLNEFGTANIEGFLSRAIASGSEDITEEMAKRAAKEQLNTLRKLDAGIGEGNAGKIVNEGTPDEVRSMLREGFEDATERQIDDMVYNLTGAKKTAGKGGEISYSKRRIKLNEGYKENLRRNPETGAGARIMSFDEMLENNAHRLMENYTRTMSGAISMARYDVPGLAHGITSKSEWGKLKDNIREIGEARNIDPKKTNKELDEMDFLYDSVTGRGSYNEGGATNQALRRARELAFLNYMGGSGFAQLPEIGTVLGGVGFKAMAKTANVNMLGRFQRDAMNGQLTNKLAREMEVTTGHSTDWARGVEYNRFNDVVDTVEGVRSTAGKYDRAVHKATRGMATISGLQPVTSVLQRMSVGAMQHRWAEAAFKNAGAGKLPWNANRMAAMGLSEEKTFKIMGQLREHGSFKTDAGGGKTLEAMNFKNWEPGLAADMQESLLRYARKTVQENDPGNIRKIMSGPLARTVLQFRSFIVTAWEKQLLHGMNMRDMQTVSQFMMSTVLGGMSHIARTSVASIGRDDRNEYLKKRLSMEAIGKASFERSSYSSLVPTAAESIPYAGDLFNSRSTGLSNSLVGNPSWDMANKGLKAIDHLAHGEGSEALKDGRMLVPFQNAVVIQQGLNLLIDQD